MHLALLYFATLTLSYSTSNAATRVAAAAAATIVRKLESIDFGKVYVSHRTVVHVSAQARMSRVLEGKCYDTLLGIDLRNSIGTSHFSSFDCLYFLNHLKLNLR